MYLGKILLQQPYEEMSEKWLVPRVLDQEIRTSLLVDIQHGYASACAPSRYFCHLVHQALQLGASLAIVFQLQYDAENLGYFVQVLHVLLYHGGIAMMVVENGV